MGCVVNLLGCVVTDDLLCVVCSYVMSTLELLVVEDYMIVYFHGGTPTHKMPALRWLKQCQETIDRRSVPIQR